MESNQQARYLRVYAPDGSSYDVPLPLEADSTFTVGSGQQADLQVSEGGAARFISPIHCTIAVTGPGRYTITDGEGKGSPSVTGTQLNGEPVGAEDAMALMADDEIVLGSGFYSVKMVVRKGTPEHYRAGQGSATASSEGGAARMGDAYGMPRGGSFAAAASQQVKIDGQTYGLADFITRALAYLIDAFIVALVAFVLVSLFSFINPPPQPQAFATNQAYLDAFDQWYVNVLTLVIALQTIYQVYFLSQNNGQTPGKSAMKVRVVKANGEKISVWDAAIRNGIGYILSGFILNLGFLWALLDPQNRTWHDYLAGTYVVRVERGA